MSIAKLNINQPNSLDFEVNITGTTESEPNVRLMIESVGYALTFPATKTETGYRVEVPRLRGLMEAGEYDCKLEVTVGEFYFRPVEDSIELDQPMQVEATAKKSKVKPTVGVQVAETAPMIQTRYEDLDIFRREATRRGMEILENDGQIYARKSGKLMGGFDTQVGRGFLKN